MTHHHCDLIFILIETSAVDGTYLIGDPSTSNIQESSVIDNEDYMGESSQMEIHHHEHTSIQVPYLGSQQPAFVDNEQPILKFDSYDDFKIAMNEYQTKTVTKFVSRNKTKDFSGQG